jgi:peptidoglycan-N-acetylglucosamine deacetylase
LARVKFLLLILLLLVTACDNSENRDIQPIEDVQGKETNLEPKEVPPSTDQLNEIKEKAKLGLVTGSEFSSLSSTIDQVKVKWGEPDKIDRAGAGYYAAYEEKGITFGYNEEGQIFDVRSYSNELQKITLNSIEKSLGRPNQVTELNNDDIYVYEITADIQLKFVIPKTRQTVDHLSVFNQKRTESENKDYFLDIKGNSNQLSNTAWQRMLEWRQQIVDFSRGQENVFINGPNKQMVALTFDDGPDVATTSAIINILEQYDVIGNFFFVGSNVEKYPEVVKMAYEKGNLVVSHSYNHVDLAQLDKVELQSQIDKAEKAIEKVIGKRPAILRPPYGETDELVASLAKEKGYSVVIWSIDTLDWSQKEATNIVKNVIDNVRNGDIILMHSAAEHSETKEALPKMIEELQKMNYQIVGLDILLNVKAYQ